MAVTDGARNGQMNHVDRLLTLFRAFRERNEEGFYRAAEAIIADELAANHHSQARDLQKALAANGSERPLPRNGHGLAVLPKDRRYGEPLIAVTQPQLDANRVMLAGPTRDPITRILQEHGQRLKLAKFGYTPKNKLLFWGPPGCGKTLTANWVASELGLPLGVVRFSALITSYLGETAAHIQRVFDMALSTPMVLLLDEADAIAKDRDDGHEVGELKRVVNSLLQAIDSFRSPHSLVIAASNHQYLFDEALWRRFDAVVNFPLPVQDQTKEFLKTITSGVKLSGGLDSVIRSTSGLSFSQIEKVVIEVVKTMILEDHSEIRSAQLASEFKKYKSTIKEARNKTPARPSQHE